MIRRVHRMGIVAGLAGVLAACASGAPGGAGLRSSLEPQRVAAPSIEPLRLAPTLTRAPRADALIGLDVYGLRGVFGSPEFQRYEPGAEIWRYGEGTCSLFVYLYEDESATMRTAFVEARADAGGELALQPCVAAISRAHQLSRRP